MHRYSFESNADDSIGMANGTLAGGAAVSGGQLVLTGGTDNTAPHVELPPDVLGTYTSATIEIWFTLSAQTNWQRLFDFGDTSGDSGGYYWFYTPSSSNSDSRLVISTGGFPGYQAGEETVYSTTVSTGTPIFVTCVYDAVAGQMRLYEEGQLVDSTSVSMLLSDVHRALAYIGASCYPPDPGFEGTVDEFRIYDTALTDTEIQEHYEWGPDSIPVRITESDGMTALYTGNPSADDDYEVVLLAAPTVDVDITVTPPAGISVGNGDGVGRILTFTDEDWNTPQTVTVSMTDPLVLGTIEYIQHSVSSDDPQYTHVTLRDIQVNMYKCESGYLESDYNLDCKVNLLDFSRLGQLWLATQSPIPLEPFVPEWLLDTGIYDETLLDSTFQESPQPFFVNTANITHTIDEKIYGHFLEHIYHSVNGGLWGDMVWNRSFELTGSGDSVWSIESGAEGDELVQSSSAADVHMEFGDTGWDDYELTLQAKKDGGNEGFLIVVRAPDSDNFYWINIAGWGNTQHAIEKEVNGSRSVVTGYVSGSVTAGVWYDITVRCEGNNIKVWLDESLDGNPDPLIFDYTDNGTPFLTGNIGVGTWQTQARFRNIEVTDLSGTTTLYSGLPTVSNDFGADYWAVFGTGDASVTTSDSLNDDYSVQIIGDGSPTGLQQDDMKFTRQAYHGSLWMKGSLTAGVKVELMDGETTLGSSTLDPPTSTWTEYPFSITPGSATDNGSLRITLLGAGTVLIDQVSMMAQDSIDTGGFRPDLLQAIQDLRPPVIRWPGGYFAELYRWKDGIGPQYMRSKFPIVAWNDQDTNSFGTDEYMKMCQAVNCQPLIVINIGSHDAPENEADYVLEAQQWVEYCNGSSTSTWGAVRAANGHPEPYNVKYWEIDNEVWFQMNAATYIDKLNVFVPALKAIDPNIMIIACGSGSFDSGWDYPVIDACADIIDYISIHHYEGSGGYQSGPLNFESYIEQLGSYIAGSSNPNVKIYASEWNLQTTDWRTGLYAGGLLNGFERTGDVFEIGGPALFLRHTSADDWDNAFINFDHTGWFPAPNYVVMKLWRDHYAPKAVETTGGDASLSVSSVLSEDEQTLYIRVVNAYNTDKPVAFDIDNSFVPATAYMEYVDTGGDIYARNTLANPDNVHVQAEVIGLDGQSLRFKMPAYSVGVITVKMSPPNP